MIRATRQLRWCEGQCFMQCQEGVSSSGNREPVAFGSCSHILHSLPRNTCPYSCCCSFSASCWHFSQPCTGFLCVLLVPGVPPCCPSLPACLPGDCWEGSASGVLMPLPRCMNANNPVWEHGATPLERLTAFSSLKSC